MIVVPEASAFAGLAIEEIERRANGRFFVLQLNRRDDTTVTTPDPKLIVNGGDGVVIVSRGGQGSRALFEVPAEPARAGRVSF